MTYDGWGRLVRWDDPGTIGTGGAPETRYVYDALYRRIEESGAARPRLQMYYSSQWQVLEERKALGTATTQYMWSPVYVDAMIARDVDHNADGDTIDAGDERLYVQHDANFNVTAIADDTGTVLERYIYDPYGNATVLHANWATDADGTPTTPGNTSTKAAASTPSPNCTTSATATTTPCSCAGHGRTRSGYVDGTNTGNYLRIANEERR